jgi:hypothetical protein
MVSRIKHAFYGFAKEAAERRVERRRGMKARAEEFNRRRLLKKAMAGLPLGLEAIRESRRVHEFRARLRSKADQILKENETAGTPDSESDGDFF